MVYKRKHGLSCHAIAGLSPPYIGVKQLIMRTMQQTLSARNSKNMAKHTLLPSYAVIVCIRVHYEYLCMYVRATTKGCCHRNNSSNNGIYKQYL